MLFQFSLLLSDVSKHSRTLSRTKELHALIITTQLSSNPFFATRIIRLYAINGELTFAHKLFDQTPHRTVYLWNSIIRAYARNCEAGKALNLFKSMLRTQRNPDSFTFACISKACSEHIDLNTLRAVHCLAVICGLGRDLVLGSSLVNAYSKFTAIYQASKVFNEIALPDMVIWNSMISSYGNYGLFNEAISLFGKMRREGLRPDGYTLIGLVSGLSNANFLNAGQVIHGYCIKSWIGSLPHVESVLVSMYSKCGCLSSAEKVFGDSVMPDVVTWSALVTGYYERGQHRKALDLFREMHLSAKKADHVLFACSLGVCAKLADISSGEEIHGNVYRHGLDSDFVVASALIDMYSKCGSAKLSILVLDNLVIQNVVCYNAAILGLGLNGQATDAFELFEKMLNKHLKPDKATFSALFCACANAGLVEDGRIFFRRMKYEFSIEAETEHYVYLVRLLAMSGRLEDAYDVIQRAKGPIQCGVWGALLSSCDMNGNHDMTNMAADEILGINSEKRAYRVMLSNKYAGNGRWNDVEKLRGVRYGAGGWKIPATSYCAI